MELGIGTEDYSNDASYIAKGKRTKRPRPLSPCAVATAAAITSSSSSASAEHDGHDYRSFSSTTTTAEDTDHEEEEDMANCLILLAQGKGGEENSQMKMTREKGSSSNNSNSNQGSSADVATTVTASTKIGYYIYECKTCNRTFPSFQALGGHRASHKRPKVTPDEKKPQLQPPPQSQLPLITNCEFEDAKQARVITTPPISLQLGCGASNNNNNKANKVHECSICGSEFASGQALGGHMRRHRASTGATSAHVAAIETTSDAAAVVAATVEIRPRKVLELDLNLPAPAEEDHRDSNKFQFTAQKSMVVPATPALVGCHY